MKLSFYLLTAAAHPFRPLRCGPPVHGALLRCHRQRWSGPGHGRRLCRTVRHSLVDPRVVIVSLLVSRLHYKEWLPTIGINTIIILIYLRLLLGL